MSKPDFEKLIHRMFDTHDAAALVHVAPFAEQLKDNPDGAIDLIFSVYNDALNEAYTNEEGENVRAFVQALAGGPCEVIPSAGYNAVGEVYPYLERKQKDMALGKILNIFDEINYVYVQNSHTPFIREPLLLSDIKICRGLYWPGLDDGKDLIGKFTSFVDLKSEIMNERGIFRKGKVKSDFVIAYTLLRRDLSDWSENYMATAEPNFLRRVYNGIAGSRFAHVKEEEKEEAFKRCRELFSDSMCEELFSLVKKRDWVDYKKFS